MSLFDEDQDFDDLPDWVDVSPEAIEASQWQAALNTRARHALYSARIYTKEEAKLALLSKRHIRGLGRGDSFKALSEMVGIKGELCIGRQIKLSIKADEKFQALGREEAMRIIEAALLKA